MGFFSSKDSECRAELDRLKLRLFGAGNTDCLNVRTYDPTNSILGGHRHRIQELEVIVVNLELKIEELRTVKSRKK